jgi:hypothetical protein
MATVEFRYDPKNTAWFTANAAMVLKAGEPAYHDTTGLFKLGDGVTALSALSFLPTVSASTPTIQQVLTAGQVATTTIETTGFIKTGGLSTQFLKADGTVDSNVYGVGDALTTNPLSQFAATTSSQLAGVISDETGSGALVFGTSPTFTTDITTPQITGVSGNLTLTNAIQSSGAITQFTFTNVANTNQTATTNIPNFRISGANKQWATGTVPLQYFNHLTANTVSAVAASTFTNVYSLFVESSISGTNSTITNNYALGTNGNVIFDDSTSKMIWRAVPTIPSYSGIFLNVNPSSTNFALANDGSGNTFLNGVSSVYIAANGTNVARFGASFQLYTPVAASSGALIKWQLTVPADTNQTATSNIPNFKVTGANKQWATGALATQYFNYFTDNTIAFVGASTATNSYNTYIESVVAGTNATLTRKYSLGTSDNVAFGIANSLATLHLGVAPSASNYMLSNAAGAGSTYLNAPTGGFVVVSIGGSNRFQVNNSSITFSPTIAIGANITNCYTFNFSSNVNQTLSSEISGVVYNNYSRQWATGNITTQREQYIKTVTYTAIGASVITNAFGKYIEAPTASTNITITNNYALGLAGSLKINDTFNIVFDTTNGSKIATSPTQKLSFWNATPIVQPTTAVAAATVVSGTGGNVKHDDTFDGYTLEKIVKALRNIGLLA